MKTFLDINGYPTEEALAKISNWSNDSISDCFDFIKELWSYPDYWREKVFFDEGEEKWKKQIDMSTGGWSGNEDLLAALRNNILIWSSAWVLCARGGKFIFEIEEQ